MVFHSIYRQKEKKDLQKNLQTLRLSSFVVYSALVAKY